MLTDESVAWRKISALHPSTKQKFRIKLAAFWSKIAGIMAWFLVFMHNRALTRNHPPHVYFEIKNIEEYPRIEEDYRTLYHSFWWQKRVYTPSREARGFGGIPEEQWMVENHEDYYHGCVMQMIQRWRRSLGEGKRLSKGSAITLSLDVFEYDYDYREHMDAIKYMGGVIAEKLGRMYGLQIYYYRNPGRNAVGISIAGRRPKYYHGATPVQNTSIM